MSSFISLLGKNFHHPVEFFMDLLALLLYLLSVVFRVVGLIHSMVDFLARFGLTTGLLGFFISILVVDLLGDLVIRGRCWCQVSVGWSDPFPNLRLLLWRERSGLWRLTASQLLSTMSEVPSDRPRRNTTSSRWQPAADYIKGIFIDFFDVRILNAFIFQRAL